MGCRFLLQRIFLTKGLNPRLLHWQADSLLLSHLGSLTETFLIVTCEIMLGQAWYYYPHFMDGLTEAGRGYQPTQVHIAVS